MKEIKVLEKYVNCFRNQKVYLTEENKQKPKLNEKVSIEKSQMIKILSNKITFSWMRW